MTREEAIDILRSYLMFDKSNMQIDIALNMAIEALQFQEIMVTNPRTAKPTPMVCKNCQENNIPRGEWEDKEVFNETDDDHIVDEWQSARCSVCGKYHTTPYMYYFDNFNFCPNCGADMRGEEE